MSLNEYWTGRDGMDYDDEEFDEDYCPYDDYDDLEFEPDFDLDSWRGFEV